MEQSADAVPATAASDLAKSAGPTSKDASDGPQIASAVLTVEAVPVIDDDVDIKMREAVAGPVEAAAEAPEAAVEPLVRAAVQPAGSTTVKLWLPAGGPGGSICFPELDDPDFAVPGLSDKAPTAVCISGGGFRATTLALGWLRALQHLGLLDRVKYLSVISGRCWC